MKKPIVIAGNGPSLTNIDYTRLPSDFDVYRCNQFYFEDKYFLGKYITGVFFNPHIFFEQYYTLKQLIIREEYSCENIYCSRMYWTYEVIDTESPFQFLFPDVIEIYKLIETYPHILSFLKYNDLYLKERVTSGILMVLIAAINGYQELYLTGIDFYEPEAYAFNNNKTNLQQLVPEFNIRAKGKCHTKNIDIKTLEFLQKEFDLHIYALSPNSLLATLFPPPPHQYSQPVLYSM